MQLTVCCMALACASCNQVHCSHLGGAKTMKCDPLPVLTGSSLGVTEKLFRKRTHSGQAYGCADVGTTQHLVSRQCFLSLVFVW